MSDLLTIAFVCVSLSSVCVVVVAFVCYAMLCYALGLRNSLSLKVLLFGNPVLKSGLYR